MRERSKAEQVEDAYKAVGECLRSVEAHFRRLATLHGQYRAGSSMEAIPLRPEEVEGVVAGLGDLRDARSTARRLLEPLDSELPAIATGPVASPGIVASSWAEATLMNAELYGEGAEEWGGFAGLDKSRQHALFDWVFHRMPNVPLFRASLKIEEARLRERVLDSRNQGELGEVLPKLTKQPRLLLELLHRRRGRWVGYEDIGEVVWGDRMARENNIYQVKKRLVDELSAVGRKDLAGSIQMESAAYRLR